MKKTVILLILIALPLLAIKHTDADPKAIKPSDIQGQDSPVDPSYVPPARVSIGRGLGDVLMTIDVLPFGCDGPSGLAWDGQYLYVCALLSDSVYVIDPTGPTLINAFPSPPTSSFGAGMEQNLWITCITTDSAYEFTTAGTPTGNGFFCAAGGHSWTAGGTEWWPDGEIWFANVGTSAGNKVYKYAVPSGTVLDSMTDPTYTYTSQRGMSYDPWNDKFWIGGWNSDSVWELNSDGTPSGRRFYMDGVAGIAYDWQSTLHPTPVLWICLQTPDQVVMVDADNPNPVTFTYFWDFEDGWQDWTHTNGGSFPAAWDVVESSYTVGSYTIAPPDAGDSSFCIDGDSGGVCHDTAMSPVVDNPGFTWFKWGMHFQNYVSYQTFYVIMRTFSTGAWNPWDTVWTYTADTPPRYDSVDISGIVDDSIQVGFVYDQPHATLAWFAAFDNVELVRATAHDASTVSIDAPGTSIAPDTTVDPVATYANTGANTETFDVYFVIDSAGVVLYNQTANITLDAGLDTTITWPAWTAGPDPWIPYSITAYTVLTGDEDPSNDTLTSGATTVPPVLWEIYSASMPTATYYHACAYSEITGTPTVYSMGGDPTYTSIFEFDCNTETWTTPAATLNHEARRLAAAVVGGNVYALGGMPGGSTTPHDYNQMYDPVAGTVTDTTPLPTARQFHCAAAWNDSLIYVLGGQSGSTYYDTVEIYDPASGTWTTGTSMPIPNRSFACGISGDTIYTAGGYNASGYVASCYMGVIDAANPANITWTAIPDIPIGTSATPGRSRVQGACALGRFLFTGGDDHGDPAYDAWFYEPVSNSWIQLPDKPTPISNTQCAVYAPALDNGTFFCPGGYNTVTDSATDAVEGLIGLMPTSIAEHPTDVPIPFGFTLLTSNPAVDNVRFGFEMPHQGKLEFNVFDVTGRRVVSNTLNATPGFHTLTWDRRDVAGRKVASGVYFYRVETAGNIATGKLILVQ